MFHLLILWRAALIYFSGSYAVLHPNISGAWIALQLTAAKSDSRPIFWSLTVYVVWNASWLILWVLNYQCKIVLGRWWNSNKINHQHHGSVTILAAASRRRLCASMFDDSKESLIKRKNLRGLILVITVCAWPCELLAVTSHNHIKLYFPRQIWNTTFLQTARDRPFAWRWSSFNFSHTVRLYCRC